MKYFEIISVLAIAVFIGAVLVATNPNDSVATAEVEAGGWLVSGEGLVLVEQTTELGGIEWPNDTGEATFWHDNGFRLTLTDLLAKIQRVEEMYSVITEQAIIIYPDGAVRIPGDVKISGIGYKELTDINEITKILERQNKVLLEHLRGHGE